MSIYLKRIYEQPKKGEGYRVLVDGLWPRGVNRETAKIDLWSRRSRLAVTCESGLTTTQRSGASLRHVISDN